MRILLCSKRDLTSVVILNDLLGRLRRIPQCQIHLVLAERTRKVETTVPELIRMKALERDLPFGLFFPLIEGQPIGSLGGPAILRSALAGLDLPADDEPSPASAERLMTLAPLVDHHGVSCQVIRHLTEDIGSLTPGFVPDVILSVRFSFVFPPALVTLPKLGVINVHPGTVPFYAGLYPHFYSMLAGEKMLGCTVHYVDEEIDSGAVLAADEVPISPGGSAFGHNLASHLLGNRLLAEVVETLAGGSPLRPVHQDRTRIRQHTYPTAAEFAAFRMKGLTLIDLKEYSAILRRFGLFEQLAILFGDERLPGCGDSPIIPTGNRG
jgi:methionyl-tRNA formyltransferase